MLCCFQTFKDLYNPFQMLSPFWECKCRGFILIQTKYFLFYFEELFKPFFLTAKSNLIKYSIPQLNYLTAFKELPAFFVGGANIGTSLLTDKSYLNFIQINAKL